VIKFFIFFVLVAFDLLSKKIVFDSIDLHTFISLTFFLDLTHIHNFGISFGLFSGLISPWLLIILGLLVVGFIFYLMKSASDMFEEWSLLIIISGALSNIIDRIFNGYVIDFIYFHYKDFFWPAFNFADIYITIGIIMIVINILRKINNSIS
tara:strand:- start:777 stop:1232 length:456 start_codon:yes stop_codon:yes gene_type:complete